MCKNVSLRNGLVHINSAEISYPIADGNSTDMLQNDFEDGFITEMEYQQASKLLSGVIAVVK